MPDGDRLDRAQAVAAIARIVGAVTVPVTADIEGGYADSPGGVAQTLREVLDAGAVGINIEDGSLAPDVFVERIAAARHTADQAGVRLFVNARTDVFLTGNGTEDQRIAEALSRADRYVSAGADGIFVPGAVTATSIGALADGIAVPLNVMVGPGSLSVSELGRLGVSRVSLGSSVAQAAYAVAQRAADELFASGTYESVTGGLDYGAVNSMFTALSAR